MAYKKKLIELGIMVIFGRKKTYTGSLYLENKIGCKSHFIQILKIWEISNGRYKGVFFALVLFIDLCLT